MPNIHPTAIVSENAKLADDVSVGAFALIEDGVEIGAGSKIEPYARLCQGAAIGENCVIGSFCTVAGLPQDLGFDQSIKSGVRIGCGSTVREGSTIHRSTREGAFTEIGKNCFLMANSHIGHDCVVGDRVIIAPFAALGGYAQIGEDTFISGGVMIHQKVRVGCGVMASGNAATSLDVPPFVNIFDRNNMAGLNLIGMMRRKVSREGIANVKSLYHAVYSEGGSPRKNAEAAWGKGMATTPEGEIFLKFFTDAPEGRHFMRPVLGGTQA